MFKIVTYILAIIGLFMFWLGQFLGWWSIQFFIEPLVVMLLIILFLVIFLVRLLVVEMRQSTRKYEEDYGFLHLNITSKVYKFKRMIRKSGLMYLLTAGIIAIIFIGIVELLGFSFIQLYSYNMQITARSELYWIWVNFGYFVIFTFITLLVTILFYRAKKDNRDD